MQAGGEQRPGKPKGDSRNGLNSGKPTTFRMRKLHEKRKAMTIQQFAKDHRLRVRLDACGDPVIYGSDAGAGERQLYFDGGQLCLMVLDGVRLESQRWKALGWKLWLGTASPGGPGRRWVQDVKITGIPLENAELAIRLARVKRIRVLSEAQLAAIAKMQAGLKAGGGRDAD